MSVSVPIAPILLRNGSTVQWPANLAVVMDDFKEYSSYECVQVDVITRERIYPQRVGAPGQLVQFYGADHALV